MNHSFLALCSYLFSPGGRHHVSLFHILWVILKYPQQIAKGFFFPSDLSCTQPSTMADNLSQNLPNRCQKRAFPYLICKGNLLPNKRKGSCTRTPKRPSQSSLSIWTETCCNVFGAQLCPVLCSFCPLSLSQIWVSELWRKWVDWPDDWAVHTPGTLKSLQISESSGSSGILAVP